MSRAFSFHLEAGMSAGPIRNLNRRPDQDLQGNRVHRHQFQDRDLRLDTDVPVPDVPGLTRPRVRLASSSMDEGMFSVLVRLDELLRVREQCGDTYVLDRIQDLYTTRFRDLGL